MTNNKDMTTINGFLDHVVTQSFYMPFTNASGTAVTTVRRRTHAWSYRRYNR